MDLTEKYVDMSEKAIEIQDLIKRSKRDDLTSFDYGDFIIDSLGDYYVKKTGACLPKQDQLQAMLIEHFKNAGELNGMIYGLYNFTKDAEYENDGNTKRFESLEQLWLGLVMKENYGKYWHKGEWREIYEGY